MMDNEDNKDLAWIRSLLTEKEWLKLDNNPNLITVDDWLIAFRDIGLTITRGEVSK